MIFLPLLLVAGFALCALLWTLAIYTLPALAGLYCGQLAYALGASSSWLRPRRFLSFRTLPPTIARQSIARLNETMTIVTRDYSPYSCKSSLLRAGRRLNIAVSLLQGSMSSAGARTVARVQTSRHATDLAIALGDDLAVVRLLKRPSQDDHSDLATMIAEGTFAFAALLYEDREGSVIEGPIAAYHVSEIDHLVARLVREAGA